MVKGARPSFPIIVVNMQGERSPAFLPPFPSVCLATCRVTGEQHVVTRSILLATCSVEGPDFLHPHILGERSLAFLHSSFTLPALLATCWVEGARPSFTSHFVGIMQGDRSPALLQPPFYWQYPGQKEPSLSISPLQPRLWRKQLGLALSGQLA